ncbi:EAL domain, c-di-GMP-specific phosphodiesterase class I (or its enzymatically inactive variant) [Amphritea atlantica]|uniref:EAL domain, c-di-GMP-specific phosphodiesterase class I (Or its enzymatically inactive variant) n=1 Tax=Amphritea atlantica TaxID=355243 RepID=A0A1H9M4I1_9GAMM|nr:EAL domain-containing protein [Amphritea atlantica]SER18556.1 EAL domain, c-di-GMP-specific phosphodiesterase class I (or its enzymatically inactive variant) [Amphritea atlantica]
MLPKRSDTPYEAITRSANRSEKKRIAKYIASPGQYRDYSLSSHFQPIYSVAHRRPIGYEGLIRARSAAGLSIPPAELLSLPQNSSQMLTLDRLCRTLHVQNFTPQSVNNEWLFVNLNAQSLICENPQNGFTQQLLEDTGLAAHRLVIEILENEVKDTGLLKNYIDYIHHLNCLIAIDDFGAGHSNFDRIWQLKPDIVKLDRNLIREAAQSKRAASILSGIISLLHQTGSLVVVEGVETEAEATAAIAANADMMQGFYFARPAPWLLTENTACDIIDQLLFRQRDQRSMQFKAQSDNMGHIKHLFQQALNDFILHESLPQSCTQLFRDPRAVRCFLLDENGHQTSSTLNPFHPRQQIELRFAPLLCGDKGNWSHRPYHYLAIDQPGTTIISEPYLSIADSRMCVTLSQAIQAGNHVQVYCCDLDWQ